MTAIISKNGQLLQLISANEETIQLNKAIGCLAVDDPPRSNMYYRGWWVDIPSPPSVFHIFDYILKIWVDPRSLEQVQDQHWRNIKNLRDAFEFGGFEFESNIYDSDQVSQGRILGASNAGFDQIWTLADNTTIELKAIQLVLLYQALQQHIANAHERGRIARLLIYEATTSDEVEAVIF